MKLKKLIYIITVASIIAPVAFGSFNLSTVQASAKVHSVSKKTAYKYAYKTTKKIMKDGAPNKSSFKQFSEKFKHEHRYTLLSYQWGAQSELDFKISKINEKIHVGVSATAYYENEGKYRKVDNSFYKQYGIKRHYTFKIKKHKHHKKSHAHHTNKVIAHDINATNYYGRKAMVYYGFKHAGGVWKINRKLNHVVTFDKDSWGLWQAGQQGSTSFILNGEYVNFGQSDIGSPNRGDLIVKISKIVKYVNNHGGKKMLKHLKKIGTYHQIDKLTDHATKTNI